MKRYYDKKIQEWVNTRAQHKLIKRIRKMGVPELDAFVAEINAEASLDPAMEHTQTCKIACKAGILRSQAHKRAGAVRIIRDRPPLTLFEIIWKTLTFIIFIEAAEAVFTTAVSKIKKIK